MTDQDVKTDNKLGAKWVLWYHDGESDWTINSYQRVADFSTVEEFLSLYNEMPSVADHFIFLMKEGYPPIWDAPENNEGGAWLFKVPKKHADAYWFRFSVYLVGETIANDINHLTGISLSPRNFNCTLKVWNDDSQECKEKIKFNMSYDEFKHGTPLYKPFKG